MKYEGAGVVIIINSDEFDLIELVKNIEMNRKKILNIIASSGILWIFITSVILFSGTVSATPLKAGVGKENITNLESGKINDSLYVKALVVDNGSTKVVIISIDAVGSGFFFENVRRQLQEKLNIKPENILINASHVHGKQPAYSDIEKPVLKAVKEAIDNMVPVEAGAGKGFENRIMENRRIKLKNGKEWTIRHANPLPPDEEVVGIGPVDPEIGLLRLNRKDGTTLAVLYNFACHPYQGVPGEGRPVTADYPGFASKVIEDNLGAMALFLQGCGGDVTTVLYKSVDHPRDAEPLGNMLGLSTLQAVRNIQCKKTDELMVIHEMIELPRRTDIPQRIVSIQAEQDTLLQSLKGTSLNFKTFIPLYIKYNLYPEYPSYYSHQYLHEQMIGRSDFKSLDAENSRNLDKYLQNIYAMDKLARLQTNISLLKEQQEYFAKLGETTLQIEIQGIKIGDFVLITFPGEAAVQIGLNIKKTSPFKNTFIAAYSNQTGDKGQPPMEEGKVGYAPTAEMFKGEAYEDTWTSLAPEWQHIFEERVQEILKKLQ